MLRIPELFVLCFRIYLLQYCFRLGEDGVYSVWAAASETDPSNQCNPLLMIINCNKATTPAVLMK